MPPIPRRLKPDKKPCSDFIYSIIVPISLKLYFKPNNPPPWLFSPGGDINQIFELEWPDVHIQH